jgi:hypothetical protein
VAVVATAHAAEVASGAPPVHLLPAAVAVVVVAVLTGFWRREVRWRSLRRGPVTVATVLVVAAAPLLFSFTVSFPYHAYRLLWGRLSVESGVFERDPALSRLLATGQGPASDGALKQAFDTVRDQSAAAFGRFAARNPGSPFAAEALCQQARLLNLTYSRDTQGKLQLHDGPVSAQALPIYDRLIRLHPAQVATARAHLDRARWSLHQVRFSEARQRYHDVLSTYETHIAPEYQPPAELVLAGVCARAGSGRTFTPEEEQGAYYEAYLLARQALAFLAANSQFEAEPLRLFVRLDPHASHYRDSVQELLLL